MHTAAAEWLPSTASRRICTGKSAGTAARHRAAAGSGVGTVTDHLTNGIDPSILHVQEDLSGLPPDSEAQQAAVLALSQSDAFNWGYDPVHYSTPEGDL